MINSKQHFSCQLSFWIKETQTNTSRFRTNNTPSCCDKKQEAKEKKTKKTKNFTQKEMLKNNDLNKNQMKRSVDF
jgi:hypothetical protein